MADTPTNLPKQAGQEIGASGTYFFQGYVTAEEYSIDLQGKYGLQAYDVMRKSDATVHAALSVCKGPILGAEWGIEPASDDPNDIEIADRMRRELFERNIQFFDFLKESMTCLDFGFFIAELVFEVTEYQGRKYIGIKKLASRKQRSILKFEMTPGEPGITQIIPSGGFANIPRNKLLYIVNDREGENYFGISMLRYAYKPWKIKDGLDIMNAVALEKMSLGIPYIKKDMNNKTTSEDELVSARNMLRKQRNNEEAYFEYPDSIEVGFTDMKSHTTKEILPTIEYLDRQITLSVLAQFLQLGQTGGSGSRAVSQDHSRLFVKALISIANTLQGAIQRDVIQRWVDLNYSDLPNGYPKLTFSTISDEDVQMTADAVSALVKAGAIRPDRDVENHLRRILNLPELTEEDYENYDTPEPDDPTATPTPKPDVGKNTTVTDKNSDLPDEDKNDPKRLAIDRARVAQRELLTAIAEG